MGRECTSLGSPAPIPSSLQVMNWRTKRGLEFHNVLSSLPPVKKIRGPVCDFGEQWRGWNLKENCLLVERAIYTDKETLASIVDDSNGSGRQIRGEDDETNQKLVIVTGKQAMGGGGWPSTAARSP